jgi:hypothetical protein
MVRMGYIAMLEMPAGKPPRGRGQRAPAQAVAAAEELPLAEGQVPSVASQLWAALSTG